MPIVEVSQRIKAPIQSVWKLVCDVEQFPTLMKPVQSVSIVERGDGFTVTAWAIELKGGVLKWTEREVHDHAQFRVTYAQLSGDLEVFEGYWQLEKVSEDTTAARLYLNFEIGIPMLREMLDPIAGRAIHESFSAMLTSLGPKAD